MDIAKLYSPNYAAARRRFRDLAANANGCDSYQVKFFEGGDRVGGKLF